MNQPKIPKSLVAIKVVELAFLIGLVYVLYRFALVVEKESKRGEI